ncbi:unnamed protein product [Rotaria magnacalcarata]|uniref:NAD(P)(+)--arginine ADP-ribosyltransferase n=1 Tax=Rotaria magnacalcarata TaxID=392030 RepID=A0A819C176_9BILA|nr:unnamed protein product [Rotaria magnacalcarata]CAF3811373.1 unnamed protein product [Rotaria magnacalcarata]
MNVITDCNIIWLDDKDIDGEDLGVNIQYYVSFSLHTFTDFGSCSSFIKYCTSDIRLLLVVVRDRYISRLLKTTLRFLSSQITVFIYVLGDKWWFHWKADPRSRDIFHTSEEQSIIDKLQNDRESYLIQRWSSGCCVFSEDAPQMALDKLNNENANFMWFQLLVRVLLRMPVTTRSKDDLLQQSFLVYDNNQSAQKDIHLFNRTYWPTDAINWYTQDKFLFRLFNQACRTDDIDLLFNFRFFIHDLHHKLKEIYCEQQLKRNQQQTIIVYRGTIMSKDEIQMLLAHTSERKLIWFTTFVSTSLKKVAAEKFVCKSLTND